MADKRITELTAGTDIYADDWIPKDSILNNTERIQLSRLKQLFGGDNFAGEWVALTTYNADAYVTHEGKLYHNITGGSLVASEWNSTTWAEITIGEEFKKILASIAPTFSTSTSYAVGALTVYNNKLYKCTTAHTGSWDVTHWSETSLQEVLSAIKEVADDAKELAENISDEYSATSAYAKGDYCIHNNTLYKCTTAIGSGGEAWNASHWSATKCDDELSELKGTLVGLGTITALYNKITYANDIGGTVTLSDGIENYKFLVINFGVSTFDSWNISELTLAIALRNNFTGYYCFAVGTSVYTVRLSVNSTDSKVLNILSSSASSLSIRRIEGIK